MVVLIHMTFLLDSQVRGISIIVGKIIFNIEGGSGFVRSQLHMC